jgi:5'-methylthioadenosine phosphorylase
VINMSTLPEAKLAREAEIAYQMICMSTDYDCWHDSDDVNVAMVMAHMQANSKNAKHLVGAVLDELAKPEHADIVLAKHLEGVVTPGLKFMTKPEGRTEEAAERIEWLYPGVWN